MRRLLRAVQRRLVASRLQHAVGTLVASVIDWLFSQQAYAHVSKRDHVLCLGDSHIRVLRYVRVDGAWFRVKSLDGATASGVSNPNSTTHSLSTFTAQLRRAKPWQQILLQLGEVDCGFVIWHRAERRGLSVEEQLTHTLDSYLTFVEQVAGMGFRRVIVLSVPLPTISDYPSEWGEVANLRKEVTATQAERTNLTLRFNMELRERCKAVGVVFLDVTTGHFDPGTRLIDPRYVRKTHQDHHLADGPYAQLIASKLCGLWDKPEHRQAQASADRRHARSGR